MAKTIGKIILEATSIRLAFSIGSFGGPVAAAAVETPLPFELGLSHKFLEDFLFSKRDVKSVTGEGGIKTPLLCPFDPMGFCLE